VGFVVKKVIFRGRLRTCERLPEPGKPPVYLVRLADRPFEEYVAEQLATGGYFSLVMKGEESGRYECQGQLDVFTIKQVTEYCENGWRVETEINETKCRVFLGGRSLNNHIGEFFEHPNKRTFYDRGWFELSFVQR